MDSHEIIDYRLHLGMLIIIRDFPLGYDGSCGALTGSLNPTEALIVPAMGNVNTR